MAPNSPDTDRRQADPEANETIRYMEQHAFTLKTQAALQEAQGHALDRRHAQVDPVHLLHALLHGQDPLPSRLLDRLEVGLAGIRQATERSLDSMATLQQPQDNVPWGQPAQQVLRKAVESARQSGDQYVALDALLAAALTVDSTASRILKDAGVTAKALEAARLDLRKGRKADSASHEDAMDALDKYARNLNTQARDGKLDPVIGRDEEIRRVLQILTRRTKNNPCLLYTSPSPRDLSTSRMPSSA